jgi:hypothetical protein
VRALFLGVLAISLAAGTASADEPDSLVEEIKGTRQVMRRLEAMSGDARIVESLLGRGFTVRRVSNVHEREDHYDTRDGSFGKQGGSLRVRTQRGRPKTALLTTAINGKPQTQSLTLPLHTTGGPNEFSAPTKPDPFVVTATTGSQTRGYSVFKDGKQVAHVDVGNHYSSQAGRRSGFGLVRYRATDGKQDHRRLSRALGLGAPRQRR